ncbi:hypothetical protein J7E97_14420 [Streptomyces sp. ISL-66]|uniref:hypothetical protein n=1 Tax=Streptomyces sp. ISL-66 TaxID=2819186 RepID=UPI001BE8BE26|nr:hypothetical protein [Streptomyces sp. ISL-66]MBT2469030.1 hypothetical protein [Streptomyces sp. ISL-66]
MAVALFALLWCVIAGSPTHAHPIGHAHMTIVLEDDASHTARHQPGDHVTRQTVPSAREEARAHPPLRATLPAVDGTGDDHGEVTGDACLTGRRRAGPFPYRLGPCAARPPLSTWLQ